MISYIVPSVGRPSLAKTLASIETWPGDEIIVVGSMGPVSDERVRFISCNPGGDWGHAERNFVSPMARGRYLMHIDDDDQYLPGARAVVDDAIFCTPDKPVLFRMQYPNGITLWAEPVLRCGNVGTPMMLIPNAPERFGFWAPFVGGDCHFLETMKWAEDEIVWRPEIIALLGHNT